MLKTVFAVLGVVLLIALFILNAVGGIVAGIWLALLWFRPF